MKRFIAALLLIPMLAYGAGNDYKLEQRNSANSQWVTKLVAPPGGSASGLLGLNGSSGSPAFFTIGAGLSLSSGVLSAPSGGAPAWSSITGKPADFPPAAHSHTAADVSSGTLADARIPALAISKTTGLQAALDGKFPSPTGTSAQYVRGDGALATLPVAKRLEQYNGTTDANGLYTVTYSTPYAAVPSVQPEPPPSSDMIWVKVSSDVNGFSLRLVQRGVVTLLSVQVLLGAVTNVSGSAARVQVIGQ